jgi:hypothetical protein
VDESKWIEQDYYAVKINVDASCGQQRRDAK